jgi:penicillin-binding protein 1A
VRKIKKFIKKNKFLAAIILLILITVIISGFSIGWSTTIAMFSIIILMLVALPFIKKNTKTKKGKRRFKNIALMGISIIGIVILALFATFMFYVIVKAPNFKPENLYKKETTIIYDSQNQIVAKLGAEKREKITYNDLPQVLIDAIIATEDSRYYQHNGFDLPRFLKASLGQATGNRNAGGASTLSMQVVKNNFTSTNQSIIRKFTDIYLAIFKLEKTYTKEQILEFYVNIPYLGGGSYGVEQACKTYFGKSVRDINLAEASLIAGMFQAPNYYDPFINPDKTTARRKTVLHLMNLHGYITEEEEKIANAIPIKDLLVSSSSNENKYQGYIDTVVAEVIKKTKNNPYNIPMKIYTNMDSEKQVYINKIMTGELYKFRNDVVQTGIAVLDINTGKIIAIGANRQLDGERTYNFATMIDRQPGSTAKPLFDYGPGMEYNNWSTYTPFLDEPYSYSDGTSIKNWDSKYQGLITLRKALGDSRNIPALKAFKNVDNKKIIGFVESLGIKPEIDGGKIHEAHSIGGFNGTNPVQLAGSYAAFGNGGYYTEPYSVNSIEYRDTNEKVEFKPQKQQVMSDSTAFMITDILRDAVQNGFNSGLRIKNANIAAKSGTTNFDKRTQEIYKLPEEATNDAWVIGYSPDYVVSLWYGYEKISNKYYNTTPTAAVDRASLFKAIGNGIFKKDNKEFKVPKSVIKVNVEKETIPAMLASAYTPSNKIASEYFKLGTEPTEVSPRFDKVAANVTNLDVTYNSSVNKYILSWDAVEQPKYLTDQYFTDTFGSFYGSLAGKYLNIYKSFNANYLGDLGYHIYSKDSTTGELTHLGFTQDDTFSQDANQILKTFVVKTGFSKVTGNQSNGSEITISDNIEIPIINLSLIGNSTETRSIGGSYTDAGINVSVWEGGLDVTNNASITVTITDTYNGPVDTREYDKLNPVTVDTASPTIYTIEYKVIYKTQKETVIRTVTIQ